MDLVVPLPGGLSLQIADDPTSGPGYPTRRLQKGLLLRHEGQDLAEEGVGFGVPILKRGVQTIFPGGAELAARHDGARWEVTAMFRVNLVERLVRRGGGLRVKPLYAAKDSLAALHRRSPLLRRPLTATSNALRHTFGWVTTFEEADLSATLPMTYTIDGEHGSIAVAVDMADLPRVGFSEVVVMNEQGARHFDRYEGSDGAALQGSRIGTWDEVTAETARFVDTAHRVAFSLGQVKGGTLHRGRELIGSRLAWSGFGYSFPPTLPRFGYDLQVERVP